MSKTIPDSIKKMTLNYCECPLGGMHAGEMMNLVCVDSACQKRGLICPVCRMNNHETHQILPLKIFLQEIRLLFMESESNDSLNNLSDYLRSLQNSRKQLINILKDAAEKIAAQFREIEENIQANYISIRRNILAQSSISTKLPNFIENLSKNKSKDAYALQEEFQKYSELIKFQNNNMNISDKSKKLVEDYSKIPPNVQNFLSEQVKIIQKSFKDSILGKNISQDNKIEQVLSSVKTAHTFSSQNKTTQINLITNKKATLTGQTQNLGIVYVSGGEKQTTKKITFKIQVSNSGAIMLGAGNANLDKEVAFLFDQPIRGRHYFSSACGDNYYEEDGEQEEIYDSFVFDENGAEVSLELNCDKNQLVFERVGKGMKRIVKINSSEVDVKNLQFFAVLAEGDQISILDA